jgi:hypothetical protein
MTTNKKAEQKRGFQQAVQQFAVLRTKWPKAFPGRSLSIRSGSISMDRSATNRSTTPCGRSRGSSSMGSPRALRKKRKKYALVRSAARNTKYQNPAPHRCWFTKMSLHELMLEDLERGVAMVREGHEKVSSLPGLDQG